MMALRESIENHCTLRIVRDEVWYTNTLFTLFEWPEPLEPGNQFSTVEIPAGAWDLSALYTDGTIKFWETSAESSCHCKNDNWMRSMRPSSSRSFRLQPSKKKQSGEVSRLREGAFG